MDTQQLRYQAYMLRLWRIGSREGLAWRASLENAHTGARQGFANLEALFAFLEETADQGLSATAEKCRSGSEQSPGRESEPYSGE